MKRIIWKKPDGSVARECVAYDPRQIVNTPAVLYSPGAVIEPAVIADGGELKTPGFIDEKAVVHAAVLYEEGEIIKPATLATGTEIKVAAVLRDETPEEVFDRWLFVAQQRESDKRAAYALAVAEGRVPSSAQLAEVDAATTPQAKIALLRPLWEKFPDWAAGDGYEFAGVCDEVDDLPACHEHYFDALEWDGQKPKPNLTKCKAIAHTKRRAMREAEFAPLDAVIAKQIPGASATEAEAQRQVIRDKYAVIQVVIDAAMNFDEIDGALLP